MKTINVNSWEQFQEKLKKLKKERLQRKQSISPLYVSPFLFRGQSDSKWSLTTTLERYTKDKLSLKEYYHLILSVKPQIETFTGETWKIKELGEYLDWLKSGKASMMVDFPGYNYMVYLRHHGFPSPLLDWTRSPHIAAFFAFCHASTAKGRVSIYVFCEYPEGGKSGIGGEPYIHSIGPYIRSHRRHFLQQSEYTICIVDHNDDWSYAPHEDAFAREDPDQDLLWKFNIPTTERFKVLEMLDDYNLNAFSLFGSEESLMETMALRELHFRERNL